MNAPLNISLLTDALENTVLALEPTRQQLEAWRALLAIAESDREHGIPWDTTALHGALRHAQILLEESRLFDVAYLNRRARCAYLTPLMAIKWLSVVSMLPERALLQFQATVLDETLDTMQITAVPTRVQRVLRRAAELAVRDLRDIAALQAGKLAAGENNDADHDGA